jgi:hypothetical protein
LPARLRKLAEHAQASGLAEPGGEVECDVQAVQEALPSAALWVLAAHALQAAASGAWPGTQRQSLTLLAAGAEVLALGPQAAQALLLAALKLPCAHGWQGPPGGP